MIYVAMTLVSLTLGLPGFIWTRKEKRDNKPIFAGKEISYLIILLALDAIVIWLFASQKLTL